jgi:hypothetical protein
MKLLKPIWGRNLITILLALSLLISACGVEGPPTEPDEISIEQQPAGQEPITEEIPTEEPVLRAQMKPTEFGLGKSYPILPPTTKVLDNQVAEQQLLQISPDKAASELVLDFSEGVLKVIGDEKFFSIDNVIAIDPTNQAPEGFLGKVTNVSRSNGILEVRTVQASLEEAIDTAEVHESIQLSVDERSVTNPGSRARLARVLPARGHALTLPIDKDLDGVRVRGTVTIQPSFDFDMIIQDRQLESLTFIDTTVTSAELQVESNIVDTGFSEQKPLFPAISLSPIGIPITKKLNIWFTPELAIFVGVDGNVSAGVFMDVSQDVTFNAGLFYDKQVGEFKSTFTPHLGHLEAKQPTFSANVDARAYVRPQLNLKVYGVDGLFAGVDAYLKLEAGPLPTPRWQIFGGVRASVGIKVKIFGFSLLNWEEPLLDKKWPLAPADIPAPVPTDIHPPPPTPTDTHPPPPTPKESPWPELAFGPLNGSLNHEIDGFVEISSASVDLRDFVAETILYNPYPATRGGWDFGFLFRDAGRDDQLRLIIESDGDWSLEDWRGDGSHVDSIDSGHLTNLDVSEGGWNYLKLIALGNQGVLFVNDSFVAPLDLTSRTNSGDVVLATELRSENEIDGEVTDYEDFTVWSLLPIFGPGSGSLNHEIDGFIEVSSAGVDLRDFVAEAIFYTPHPATRGGWDFGFLFRDGGVNEEFRLVIESDGDWSLEDLRGDSSHVDSIDSGHLTNLDVSEGGWNYLKLIALGNQGVFFVNDSFVAPLDLTSRTNSGDILLGTDLRSGNEIDGAVTDYEDFTIWSLP